MSYRGTLPHEIPQSVQDDPDIDIALLPVDDLFWVRIGYGFGMSEQRVTECTIKVSATPAPVD